MRLIGAAGRRRRPDHNTATGRTGDPSQDAAIREASAIPDSPAPGRGGNAPPWRALLLLAATAAICALGLLAYEGYTTVRDDSLRATGQRLSAISETMALALQQYRAARQSEAEALVANPLFASVVAESDSAPQTGSRATLSAWLAPLVASQDFEAVWVLDGRGTTLLAIPSESQPLGAVTRGDAVAVIASGQTMVQDLYRDDRDGREHMAVVVPIPGDRAPDARPAGAVVFSIDPWAYLHPLLDVSRTESATLASMLVRAEGDTALVLDGSAPSTAELRAREVPGRPSTSVEALAALGTSGLIQSEDSLGHAVVGFIRPIPGSPWNLIVEDTSSDALAPATRRLAEYILGVALTTVAALAAGTWLWQRRELRHLRERSAAQRRQALLHEMIAHSVDEIYVFDPGTLRIRFANEGALGQLGYGAQDLPGLTLPDFLTAPQLPTVRDLLARLVAPAASAVRIEGAHRRKDGSTYPVETHLQRVATADGHAVLAIAHDLSERRRLEDDRERLEAAIDQLADAVVIVEADHRIRYANQAFLRMTGFTRDELYGNPPSMLAGPATTKPDAGWPTTDAPWRGSIVAHSKDGTPFEAEWAIGPIRDETGMTAAYVASAHDRSGERALEARIAQIERIEAIGQLAAGIAHDFNNLLTTTGGYAELLRDELPPDDPRRAEFDPIIEASEHGAQLVRQLLAFGRRQVLKPQVLDLSALLRQFAPMVRQAIGSAIELDLRLADGLGVVRADPSQIEQVVINLALNARDAMPLGGRLSITTAMVEIGAHGAGEGPGLAPGQYVRLEMADTGVGMDASTLEHAFEPFFTTKTPDRGTGLGLSTVHGIVAQSGGHVRATSRPGHGTTVSVWLPRTGDARRSGEGPQPVGPQAPGSGHILLVIEEAGVRTFASLALRRLGYDVVAVPAGPQALEVAADGSPFDLLITDVVMPGMGGPELAERLAARIPRLRVLFVSGYAAQTLPADELGGQRRAFLPKPFSSESLGRAVRDLLDPGVS